MLTVGSLFSGVGGFDLAAERVGMRVLWQAEVDRFASLVLAERFVGVKNFGDVNDICMAGKGRSSYGAYTGVVSGVGGYGSDGDIEPVLRDHEGGRNCGRNYRPAAVDVLVGGFPCQDYSVAGLREGLAGDSGALWWQFHRLVDECRPLWVIGENVPGLLSSRGGRDFASIIDSLTDLGYGVAWGVLDSQYFGVAQRRRRLFIVGYSGGRPRPEVLSLSEGLFGDTRPERFEGEAVAALTAKGIGVGGPDSAHALAGHLIPEGTDVRRLTPLEVERLQGFPDNWTEVCSDTQRYRQMGNAVTVPVAEWILERIVRAT